MRINRIIIEKMAAACVLTAFMGQLYLNPFLTSFRFSLAVTTLTLLLIFFKDIPIVVTGFAVGVFNCLFRTFIFFSGNPGVPFGDIIKMYYPVAFFYIVFGIIFEVIKMREKVNRPVLLVLYLWFADSISNIIEATLRINGSTSGFENIVLVIIFVGLVRAIFTSFIFYMVSYYMNRYERRKKESRYQAMVMFIANLKSELFFLRKSIFDIEAAMKKSYLLYEKIDDPQFKEDALTIAKDIHEVKKDYVRVVTGIERTLSEENKDIAISIKGIYSVIKQNTEKLISVYDKKIVLIFDFMYDFETKEFYPLISALNNLIINGIEAIDDVGVITVGHIVDKESLIITVKDSGKGIDTEELDLIFEPGFSTKFNKETGEMSTGIGLTHVKHIVENYFKGTISVHSTSGGGTTFTLTILLSIILDRE